MQVSLLMQNAAAMLARVNEHAQYPVAAAESIDVADGFATDWLKIFYESPKTHAVNLQPEVAPPNVRHWTPPQIDDPPESAPVQFLMCHVPHHHCLTQEEVA